MNCANHVKFLKTHKRDNEMLLPDKHIRIAESLIGVGGYILDALKTSRTIDELWKDFEKINNSDAFPAYHSFENLILSVDFLFSIGAVNEDSQGNLFRCDQVDENYMKFRKHQKTADKTKRNKELLKNKAVVLKNAIENIRISLKIRPDIPLEKLFKVYEEAKTALPNSVVRDIHEVSAFHQRLISNRIKRLTSEKTRLEKELKSISDEISALGKHRDKSQTCPTLRIKTPRHSCFSRGDNFGMEKNNGRYHDQN